MRSWIALWVVGLACQPVPAPVPPDGPVDAGTDVVIVVDATPASRCIDAKLADPHVRNVAAQTDTDLATLVARICHDETILEAYR